MPADEPASSRAEEILAKIDREVARRRALQREERELDARPPAAPAAPVPPAAAAATPTVSPPPAPLPPVPPTSQPTPRAAPEAHRPISLADPNAPTPSTLQELSSGLAAARRRLAIVHTQLDDLTAQVDGLNEQARRIREDQLLSTAQPLLSPPPTDGSVPVPVPAPARSDVVLPTGADAPPLRHAPKAPEPPAEAPAPAPDVIFAPPTRTPTPTPAGMRIRPRPPTQSQQRLPPVAEARLLAVELAVSGHTRGDVTQLLQAKHPEVDVQTILDPLYGSGTPPTARMSGT